jgi:hypothetical protein
MKRIMLAASALFLLAGCAGNTIFVYKPSSPVLYSRKLPIELAVLPFADGSDPVTIRGSSLAENLQYNLARVGISHRITALTPALWAKAFADETGASGDFRGVRFFYDVSELTGEEYLIKGTIERAFATGFRGKPNEFAVRFQAIRRSDDRTVWEKGVSRTWVQDEGIYKSCSVFDQKCPTERGHGDFNRAMREIFTEARADLVQTLEPLLRSRDGVEPPALSKPTAVPESVDKTIENILKGQ